jgi:hypothetical protein
MVTSNQECAQGGEGESRAETPQPRINLKNTDLVDIYIKRYVI